MSEAQMDCRPKSSPVPSGAAAMIRLTLGGLLTFVVMPYLWARVVATCMLMDFRLKHAPWFCGFAVLIGIIVGLMRGLEGGGNRRRLQRPVLIVLLIVWIGIGTAIILSAVSPFTERIRSFIPIYVLSTLWIFWLWAMPMTGLRRSTRLAVFVILLLCAMAFPVLVTFDGLDGSVRPIAKWRFTVQGPLRTTDRGPQPPASVSTPLPTVEIPSFPQFLGPNRTGVVTSAHLSHDLNGHPPRERWRHPVGRGWSAFATHANRAVTQEQRGEKELVVCYEIETGSEVWTHGDNITFRHSASGDGPRATPTIVGERVYTVGATGQLNCLDLATGKLLWAVNILEDNHAENLLYGQCGSPLVVGQWVIVSPAAGNGRSLAAYRKDTGEAVWRSGDDGGGYSSPTLVVIANTPQVLTFNAPGVSAHDVETGALLWTHPWQNSQKTNCSQPVLVAEHSNRVLISTGYGKGSCMIELAKTTEGSFAVNQLWTSRALNTRFSIAVIQADHAYGLDNGVLACIDLADGRHKWKGGRYGHGQILLADDLLIIQAESGAVAFVQVSPAAFSELYRMKAMSSKTWNNPALAGPFLLVRNDREAVCYELWQEP
jgi:outer membrane protein assembly factor BamB